MCSRAANIPREARLEARGQAGAVHGDRDGCAAAAVQQQVRGRGADGADARVARARSHERCNRVAERHATAPVHVRQRRRGRAPQAWRGPAR